MTCRGRAKAHGLTVACLLAAILAVSGTACAGDFARVRLGFEGQGRVGHLMPADVQAVDLPADTDVILALTAADPQGNLCQDLVARSKTDSKGRVSLSGVFAVGRLDGSVQVALLEESSQNKLCELTVAVSERTHQPPVLKPAAESSSPAQLPTADRKLSLLRQSAWCVLCVGMPAGLSELEQELLNTRKDQVSLAVLRIPDVASLPTTRFGLDGIDILFLTDDFSLSAEQATAVREWVLTGGRLLISAGSTVDALSRSPLGDWVAPKFGMTVPALSVRDLAPLQNFVPGAVQLQTNRIAVPMARLLTEQARVIVDSLDGPIVARRGVGSGIITFVAVDLNQRPVNNWRSLPKLYEMLVFDEIAETVASAGSARSIRISSSGISDLSTQLSAVYDAIPPSERWSSWQIMVMVVGYLVVIGPLDYLLVVRLLRRPHLTWITFPLLVVLGCGFVYAQSGLEKPAMTQREFHLLDLAGTDDGQTIHTRSWASLSSATSGRYEISAAPHDTSALPASQTADSSSSSSDSLRWYGRAEDVYGGMYRTGGAGLGRQKYQRSEADLTKAAQLTAVPFLAEGSQCFSFDEFRQHSGPPLFESGFSASGTGLIEGDLISRLPLPIDNWMVFYGNRVYMPSPRSDDQYRSLVPGQVWNRRQDWVRASDLKSYLNGFRVIPRESSGSSTNTVRGDSQQIATPYNPRGENPLDILMMVSLYHAAGAESFVGLRNDPLRRMELTDSIRLNYALLLGTIERPLTDFSVDGQVTSPSSSTTVIRLLIPVDRQQNAPPASLKSEPDDAAPNPGLFPAPATSPVP